MPLPREGHGQGGSEQPLPVAPPRRTTGRSQQGFPVTFTVNVRPCLHFVPNTMQYLGSQKVLGTRGQKLVDTAFSKIRVACLRKGVAPSYMW